MESQVTNNANALRLFFTEDVFLVEDKTVKIAPDVSLEAVLSESAIGINDAAVVLPIVEIEENEQDKPAEELKSYVQNAEISPVVETPEVPRTYKFLGGNKKSVLILVNDSTNDVSTEQGRELLRKIVKAIDLATPDFALVNYANYPGTDFIELHQFFKPGLMLAFGVEAKHLKLNLNWAGEIILHESTKIIFAPDLHALDSDIAAKKSLWGNLQKIR